MPSERERMTAERIAELRSCIEANALGSYDAYLSYSLTEALDIIEAQAAELTALREALREAVAEIKRANNQIDIHATNAGHGPNTIRALMQKGNDVVARIAPLLEGTAAQRIAAAQDVLDERERQKSAEGWTPEHDDTHVNGQMAGAAGCYALMAVDHWAAGAAIDQFWPWTSEWWKPTDRRRNLVKAGALILAEIERLDRAARSAHRSEAKETENAE